MKGLIVTLLLLVCALCALAQPSSQLPGRAATQVTTSPVPGDGTGDIGLFAVGCGALASLLFVWSPFGAAWRRRLGSRAELSALILALLLCGILAIQGCAAASVDPNPPAAALIR
jgi:hypothetical protein